MSETTGLVLDYLACGKNGLATVTARIGDEVIAHEKLDFGKPDARTRFAASMAKDRPGIDVAIVQRELLQIGAELSARHLKAEEEPPCEPDRAALLSNMPSKVRQEARQMLEAPNLFVRCYCDIAATGVAGEETLAGTIYLVGVSRLLPRPLAAIVQAPSSTGKSYVVDKVAALFPPEAVIHATSMTAQALFYLEPGALKHKWIVAGERSRKEDDDIAETTRALREMISSGRLTKLVPIKEGGRIVTQRIEQPGPVAYIETTTLARIFDEDANRCLLLNADERPQQTTKIVNCLAASYCGAATSDVDAIVQRHHALQRTLQQRPVVIPFAEKIASHFPNDRVEARRAFPHLMSMVQASALLHQYQRQMNSGGQIIASTADYRLARLLCRGPLARLLGGRLAEATLRYYDRLREWAVNIEQFTTTDAAKKDRATDRAIRGWLRELAVAGAVEQLVEGKGSRPAVWRLTAMDRDDLEAGNCDLPEDIEP